MFGLIRLAASVTRLPASRPARALPRPRLRAARRRADRAALAAGRPARRARDPDLTFYEWGILAITAAGVLTVLLARTRLFAILALGVQGLALAMIFLLFGAPDLAFTQFMVEILSVVILALVMTRLHLDTRDTREFEDLMRDGGIALLCGVGVTLLLFAVLNGTFDPRLSDFFNANSVPIAHGRNVVNVILVDFRGLDTLGEISVVMTAGIALCSP
jgi:multicomponent Na+:H+ antiporter subunit A